MDSLTKQKNLLRWAKGRADKQGLNFNLTVEDIEIPELCPVLGIPLIHGVGRPCDNSPTLDKVVPELGYVKGNIIIISNRANRLKSDASFWEMKMITEFYEEHITKEWMQ